MNTAEIDKAIAAHGLWKQRLRTAIDTGKSEFVVEKVRTDNQCDFGKWFYGLAPADRASPQCKVIQDLHAKFHVEASKVLDLALKGQKAEAEKLFGVGSQFMKLSMELTQAMMKWKAG